MSPGESFSSISPVPTNIAQIDESCDNDGCHPRRERPYIVSDSDPSSRNRAKTGCRSGRVSNLWNTIALNKDVWGVDYDEEADDDEQRNGKIKRRDNFCNAAQISAACVCTELRRSFQSAKKNPILVVLTLTVFSMLCTSGLVIVRLCAKTYTQDKLDVVEVIGREARDRFLGEFEKALLPVHALAQLVTHDQSLEDLAQEIGTRGSPGAAPGWPEQGKEKELRDVRGICDDPDLLRRFDQTAKRIKKDSKLGDVLASLRLAPMGVICLVYPKIYLDDYYNSTDSLYGDWATDNPVHITALRHTLEIQEAEGTQVLITGPYEVKSSKNNGSTTTRILFSSHLAVPMLGHYITVRGTTFESWGFVQGVINWSLLVDQSNIRKMFHELGIIFKLERTTMDLDSKSMEYFQDTFILAESRDESVSYLTPEHSISIPIDVYNDQWILTVGYKSGFEPSWKPFAMFLVIFLSFIVSILLILFLTEKKQHDGLLYKIMPRHIIQKLKHGETVVERHGMVTVFFSDVVEFNTTNGGMCPGEIMRTINALYAKFDKLAEKHKVYKVETIGDAYVVVGGACDQCLTGAEGAEKVARFAVDAINCSKRFRSDEGSQVSITGGLASGPVVAALVGSAIPRYCFFGETVNFASKMRTTSAKMKIQCSESTYRLLLESPATIFQFKKRQTPTYWITGAEQKEATKIVKRCAKSLPQEQNTPHAAASEKESKKGFSVLFGWKKEDHGLSEKNEIVTKVTALDSTLIQGGDYGDDIFTGMRNRDIAISLTNQSWKVLGQGPNPLLKATSSSKTMINRIVAVLEYRLEAAVCFKLKTKSFPIDNRNMPSLSQAVRDQLRLYVSNIESLYLKVHYHSFEHASHVVLSTNKLVQLLIQNHLHNKNAILGYDNDTRLQTNHLGCDPMAHFTIVFAALVHDVCHKGRSNQITIDLKDEIASRYDNKSVLEQNSIDVALQMLNESVYTDLKNTIFPSESCKQTFEKVFRSMILCTDIASKEQMQACKERWNQAYGTDACSSGEGGNNDSHHGNHSTIYKPQEDIFDSQIVHPFSSMMGSKSSLKSCVVLEHIIQVADVAHLMQGWANFIKWNYRLFQELNTCFEAGWMPDPSLNWSKDQISFFDGYVLPLAKRMDQTEMFGSNVTKLMRCAEMNRARWLEVGKEVSKIMANGIATREDEDQTVQRILNQCPLSAVPRKVGNMAG
mmetsp:Transcript_49724/g.73940  ORF Transcript_49724/g.73940 Transcript_49724/m.73940 type:complete len:1203 (+) Transcript_49724:322-3930(+)|eukprot:CAMPEP_0195522764 /NCGR_PEP_ID=MMETSP0794_2-20130614/21251_1 /TAXON_ID=515487 /ORGANISM="Stephanopyxis turris, Strain CCMP 815" /LENGTH=1202 /DNA_ID=CAMNT_0040652605 /DNA_START=312 /DNA_END=3920 /DNA_ORIENTATION=+